MRTWLRRLCFGLAVGLSMVVRADEEQMRTVIYPVVFGDPAALEVISTTIVGDDGHVFLDPAGRRLIVVTTDSKHAQLNQILGAADRVVGNVRIDVRFRNVGSQRDSGASLSGQGSVVTGPGGTRGRISLQPQVHQVLTESSSTVVQTLMVASGREASLRVGEQVPFIQWISEFGWNGGFTESLIQWQDVGSFLVVQPVIMGDQSTINIRLTPELRGLVDGNPYRTTFTALSTEVMVRDGETMSIGGAVNNREFYSRFLVGVNRSGVQESLDIELTPRIIQPSPVSR